MALATQHHRFRSGRTNGGLPARTRSRLCQQQSYPSAVLVRPLTVREYRHPLVPVRGTILVDHRTDAFRKYLFPNMLGAARAAMSVVRRAEACAGHVRPTLRAGRGFIAG